MFITLVCFCLQGLVVLYLLVSGLELNAGNSLFSGEIHANTLGFSVLNEDLSILMAMMPTLVLQRSNYWKQQAEKDLGQKSTNPHILAARIIARGGPITVEDVNAVLQANKKAPITEQELEQLKALSYVEYKLPIVEPKLTQFTADYPKKVSQGKGKYGIYMFINQVSGVHYVGSSTVLHQRIRHYWKNWSGSVRKILLDIKTTGIQYFTLRIFLFPDALRDIRLTLALEQYYLLSINPQNNTLYVADGSPGGMAVAESHRKINSKKVYMFEDDKLVHIFDGTTTGPGGMATIIGAGNHAIAVALRTGELYMNYFKLTREYDPNVSLEHLKTLDEIKALLKKGRQERVREGSRLRYKNK